VPQLTGDLWVGMKIDPPAEPVDTAPTEITRAAAATPPPDPEYAAVREVIREIANGPVRAPPPPMPSFCPVTSGVFVGTSWKRACQGQDCALWGRYAVARLDNGEPTPFEYLEFVAREGCTYGRQVLE
jgi:hypothetical protein